MSDYISQDILALVLKWLPVKPLLRFRSVSKGWKAMIDSPLFKQEHLSVQKPHFFLEYDGRPEYLVVDPHGLPSLKTLACPIADHRIFFWGTHHGVICLFDEDRNSLLIWNPAIRRSLSFRLPNILGYNWGYIIPTESCFGFWFDPSSKEYKLIILNLLFELDDEDDEPMEAVGVLYSSTKRSSCRVIRLGEMGNWKPQQLGPGVMIDGVAHWKGYKQKKDVILSFDFEQESFDYIEMPDRDVKASHWVQTIHCKWQGTLSLVRWNEKSPHRCDISLWQEGQWVNLFGFNLPPQIQRVFWVLGEKERVKVLAETRLELALYDAKTGCVSLKDGFSDAFVAYDFVESFLFP